MSAAHAADAAFMRQALALAALGEGTTSPNPRVGCVVVRDGAVVGAGWHRVAGSGHAETSAIAEAGSRARGATAYVNLEPCSHHGRTPPCVDVLVASGISRVVAAIQDPNPLVDGRGFARLRAAGIEVDVGLLEEDARRLNAAFLHWHTTGKPLVTLKVAATLDGRTSARDGASRWITGESARRFAHRLRRGHDAVLVGAETVRRDDPRLDVRLPDAGGPGPLAVVLATRPTLDRGSALFRRALGGGRPPRVYVPDAAARAFSDRLGEAAAVVPAPGPHDRVELDFVLGDLGRLGVQSVLVEGGARTHAAFLRAGLARRLVLFQAPLLMGDGGARPLIDAVAAVMPDAAVRLARARTFGLGPDALVVGDLEPGAGDGGARSPCSPG